MADWVDKYADDDAEYVAEMQAMQDAADAAGWQYMIQQAVNPSSFKKPYPYYLLSDGRVDGQSLWRGNPYALLGFQKDKEVPSLDLRFDQWVAADLQAAVGMYPVLMKLTVEDIEHDTGGKYQLGLAPVAEVASRAAIEKGEGK